MKKMLLFVSLVLVLSACNLFRTEPEAYVIPEPAMPTTPTEPTAPVDEDMDDTEDEESMDDEAKDDEDAEDGDAGSDDDADNETDADDSDDDADDVDTGDDDAEDDDAEDDDAMGDDDESDADESDEDADDEDETEDDADGDVLKPLMVSMIADNFSYAPSAIEARAGQEIVLTIKNSGTHDIVIDDMLNQSLVEGMNVVRFTPTAAGTYTYYCSIGKHREMGMEGTLTVTE